MTGSGIRDTQSSLARAGDLLAEPLEVNAQLNALARVVLPELADCCAIYLVHETDEPVLVAVRHTDPAYEGPLRIRLEKLTASAGQPYGAVLATGIPQLTRQTDSDIVTGDQSTPAVLRSAYTVPLINHDRVLGAVWMGRTRPDEWTEEDCEIAQRVAERAASAVANAQLFATVLAARQLLVDLQRITAALADATSVDDVAQVVIERARIAIGADSAVMATRTNGRLNVLASAGMPADGMQQWQELTLRNQTPSGRALALGIPLFLGTRAELAEQFPEAARVLRGEAHAALPLRRRGRQHAVVRFSWNSSRRFAPGEQEFLLSVAQQAASSLERAALLAAEQDARAAAEASRLRADLLAEITHSLAASLDIDAVLGRLANLVVPRLADLCTVDLIDEPGKPPRLLSIAAVTPRLVQLLYETDSYLPRRRNPKTFVGQTLTTGRTMLASQVNEEHLRRISVSDKQAQLYLDMDLISGCVVPLTARGQVIGAVSLFTTKISGRVYDESDAELMTEVGRRAGLSVDNARLFTREHEAAETLQRSLLPELPILPGLDAAARYLPAAAHAGVGGDLFDLFALPDGATAVAIGDVMGHDMRAAAAMGQLRSVLRSYAWEGASPGVVLDRMDLLVQNFEMAQLATALYARLETDPAGRDGRLLRYANAGHLPPILQYPDGTARLLEDGQSVLIGAPGGHPRTEALEPMPTGSTLLLYTDGLIEVRRQSLDEGIGNLLATVKVHDPAAGAEALCAAVVDTIAGVELIDDVALLAVRLL